MNRQHDATALQVAKLAQEREEPAFAVLFGSRARGDHDEQRSDIDILLIAEREPGPDDKQAAETAANRAALAAYGRHVPVQLVWRTPETFRLGRRYSNSLETNAIRDGIIMPDNHPGDPEPEATEYEYNWTNYDNRMLHAELHLDMLRSAHDSGKHDLMLGHHAHSALEHGMKALLEAHGFGQGRGYRSTHNIGELLGNLRYRVPELKDFRLSIDPDIYTEYGGGKEYQETRLKPTLTSQPDYLNRTAADIELIISHARRARHQPPPQERPTP